MDALRTLVAGAIVAAIGACAKGPAAGDTAHVAMQAGSVVDAATVKATIDSLDAKQIAGIEKADLAGATGNYAPDAIFLNPGSAAWNGQAAITKGFGDLFATYTISDVKFGPNDVMTSGDLAVETGSYSWTLTPKKKGKAIADKGKFITVWKRQADGSWKIVRDISNSDM